MQHGSRAGKRRAKPQAAGGGSVTRKPGTDVVPARLGNYELEERLGSGGMGDVFKARHTQFGRVRAVKVIKQHFVETGHDEVIRRFYQEIKAVGVLEHPNIVKVFSSGVGEAVYFTNFSDQRLYRADGAGVEVVSKGDGWRFAEPSIDATRGRTRSF